LDKLRFFLPIVFALVILLGLFSPVLATKGSYPGVNGKIAYTYFVIGGQQSEIFVMNNDGTGSVQLTDDDVFDDYPCWSPDGSKIAYIHGDYPNRQVWVMDADGNNRRQLTTHTEAYVDADPAWSPDGSKIAYTRFGTAGGFYVYVIDAAGPLGEGTLLISDGARHPSWSPDGSEIVYERYGSIKVADATTGGPKRTLTSGPGADPCWSPDGSKIVFENYGTSPYSIWVMNAADGSDLHQLNAQGKDPNWSPDGTRIAFYGHSDSIWVMNAGGTDPHNLIYGFEPDYQRLPSPTPARPSGPSGYVGGELFTANKLAVLAPYLALASIVAVAAVVVKRKLA
jgi:TolB protein